MRRLPSKNPTTDSSSDARQSKGSSSSTSECRPFARGDMERDDPAKGVAEEPEGYIELTLISAQGLKDVRMFGSMSPYAIVWIDPSPSCKHRTKVSENTGCSPVWDYFLSVPVYARNHNNAINAVNRATSMKHGNASASKEDLHEEVYDERLTIQIFSEGAVSDVLVGTAHIPLQDIIHSATNKLQYLACQLVRPSGRIQGLVNLSLQYCPSSSCHSPHEAVASSKLTRHEPNLKPHPTQGQNRNSWFFLSENMEQEGGEASQTRLAAPDYLDFKADGEAGGGSIMCAGGEISGASRSSSSANESLSTSTPHSPIAAQAEFLGTQPHVTSKSMFDNTFDALALADAALDLTQHGAVSMVQPEPGSTSANIANALLGLAMSQPLQGDIPSPFNPSPSS